MGGNAPAAKVKHVPQRTCVACGSTSDKRSLVRIVRTPEGAVEVDEGGKRSGRGAYLCASADCWEADVKKKRLDHGLHTTLSAANRETLRQYAERLFQTQPA